MNTTLEQPREQSPPLEEYCAACGRRLRWRGRRRSTTIWECENDACPVVLVEIHHPAPARRPGGGR